MANKQDEQVQALFKIVQEKKAEIAKTEKPSWETNCSFRYNPNSASEDHQIQTVKKVSDLVRINVYITELDDEKLAVFRTVRDTILDLESVPASTVIGVHSLFKDSTIEIDAIAAV